MKKLNNKGFAISTMLYGILTLVILVLTLLLTIMRSAYNKENAATENITYYLNKCMAKQVALEDCYKTYDDDPTNLKSCSDEYETYTSCLGKAATTGSSSTIVKLYSLALDIADNTNDSGLIVDSTETTGTRYIYTGSDPKNYIKYGSKIGRIISIETDSKIKVIFHEENYATVLDTVIKDNPQSGKQVWINSAAISVLKNKFNGISYSDRFVTGKFYTGTIQTSNTVADALAAVKSEYTTEYQYGLLTLDDYLKASSNIATGTCSITSGTLDNALTNCKTNNWLGKGNTCAWTMTGVLSEGKISNYVTTSYEVNEKTPPTSSCDAYMVVYLPASISVGISGDGSSSNPFIIDLSK